MYFWKCRPVRMFTLATATCLTFGASAADNSLQAVFTRMDQAAKTFKGLTADMKRLAHEGSIGEEETDTGTIKVRVPKAHDVHMLVDFKDPDGKTSGKIVQVAGSKVLIYYPKAGDAQEMDFGRAHKAAMEQFLKLGFGSSSRDIQDGFTVKLGGPEKINGEDTTRIVLTPKSEDLAAQFPQFELWISDKNGIAVQQKMYQPGKTYNVATYSHMALNPNLSDSDVKIKLPSGVKVQPLRP